MGIVMLLGFLIFAANVSATEAGHPINCHTNPTEASCDYSNLN